MVPQADVLIAGGTIYDGGAGKPYVGDVALKGDRIVYVGRAAPMQAAQRIDARGMIVAPGFIDAHTHADGFLRSPDPAQRVNAAWLDQGVSTVVIGVDGYGTPDVGADAARIEASRVPDYRVDGRVPCVDIPGSKCMKLHGKVVWIFLFSGAGKCSARSRRRATSTGLDSSETRSAPRVFAGW